ncbi:MAG: molecular chaperone TorD family protein [Senegalimassilia anaerobia]|uniref:TorD/DmsD family molecular chaperone n=1 Tax=Senegalimassilia anaerobia TaxID=1473216 RepID=UPI002E777145|nr:molecular chaperone TorD family protein [Senegalimassilia anaerobia]MEE0304136.1 molecular chaperone TorD family protein [Senegalimassilia anaerobia]
MDQTNLIVLESAVAQEMREANETRAAFCRFLASLYLYELTDEQIEAFAHIEVAGDGTLIDEGLRTIKEYLRHRHGGTRQELAVDYARVFLGAGSYDRILAPPYESVFTSEERILMQDARDGAVTYYRRAGLDLPADNTTPEDHLGFELQFAAALADNANEALAADDGETFAEVVSLARSFFVHHQQNWLPALCEAIDEFAETDFYRGVAQMTRGYVESESSFFDEVTSVLSLGDEVDEILPAWDVADEGAPVVTEGTVA